MSSGKARASSLSSSSDRQGADKKKKKRGHHDMENPSDYLNLPDDDLTVHRLDEFLSLTDRQKICWALQTETRVRLEKVKQRGNYESISKTLNEQDYLIDLYPPLVSEDKKQTHKNEADAKKSGKEKMEKLERKFSAVSSDSTSLIPILILDFE